MEKFKMNWLKAFEINSPSTACKYKPIINIEGRVKPLFEDEYVHLSSWIIATAEEFYYQNSIYISSKYRNSESKTKIFINISRADLRWPERLVDFRVLGKGSYGNVFLAKDIYTSERLAIKQIAPVGISLGTLLSQTTNILHERNDLLKANDSHFIVRFYASFQDKYLTSFWLVFEFCIGSVQDFLDKIELKAEIVLAEFWNSKLVQSLYGTEMRENRFDIQTVIYVFIFEICCGLDYLGKRHIVHNDIKPANVLISQSGHFKITDLGMTERMKWIDRNSTVNFLNSNLLKAAETTDVEFHFKGTIAYTDPETLIFLDILDSERVYSEIQSPFFPLDNPNQDFLTDLYSAGLSMLDVMFFGVNPVFLRSVPPKISERFQIDVKDQQSKLIWRVRCVYDDDVRTNYLYRILDFQKSVDSSNIINFIKSIFLPRSQRALNYTKEVKVTKFKNIETRRCIDIDKVKEIEYYKSRGVTEFNVIKVKMPSYFLKMFKIDKIEQRDIIAKDLNDLAEKMNSISIKKHKITNGQQIGMDCFHYQDAKFSIA